MNQKPNLIQIIAFLREYADEVNPNQSSRPFTTKEDWDTWQKASLLRLASDYLEAETIEFLPREYFEAREVKNLPTPLDAAKSILEWLAPRTRKIAENTEKQGRINIASQLWTKVSTLQEAANYINFRESMK